MTYRTSQEMLTYNALDCAMTWEVADAFMHELDDGYRGTYNHTIDMYNPLMYMMMRGIRVDHERLKLTKERVDKELADIEVKIIERCGRWVNPNSPKDCCTYFYVEKGIPAYTKYNKKTGKSSITCDDKSLQRIYRGTAARKGLYEAKLMQNYRGLKKLKGTYLDIVFDKDDRMRCSYNPRGTKFGRISSSKTIFETGMNMQNLPEEFAGFLCSDPGYIFVSLDKAKAEWVVVAYESGDASMINAIESGVDVHAYTAEQMFKIPLEIIELENKIIGHSNDAEEIARKREAIRELDPYRNNWLPRTTSIRQCGKKSNHGLNYDERYKMFALTNEITEKEAKVIVNFYHSIYPGIKLWYDRIQSKLGEGRILTNCFGRKCRFLDRWGDDLFKAAYSYLPQSTVGEVVNRAMVEIYNDPHEVFADWEMLRQVHDSIDSQMPDTNSRTIARAVRRAERILNPTLTAGGRDYKINTDCKIGYSFDSMIEIEITDEDIMTDSIRKAIDELKAA